MGQADEGVAPFGAFHVNRESAPCRSQMTLNKSRHRS